METIAAFGDSVLKGVIYENEHYRVSDASFQKICEEYFGITIENKAKFGSTISKGEQVFERNLNLIRDFDGKYVVLEFGGNDC
ncbi:MAG: SGNH/GDSL hydrolase family protein, partial [Clostridiales bacterium]|nr:SGNH/GDSL hydrolase family protein [Clostridiales bacterium]